MANANRFAYRTLTDLVEDLHRRGLDLPVCDDLSILAKPLKFGARTIPNRLVVQPMEGCDADAQGRPSELMLRRYRRYAAGGAGLIWFEACAVVPQGRANPRQLWLHEGSADAMAQMVRQTRLAAAELGHKPVLVLQLTHSGRYSRPIAAPAPIIAHHSKPLDPRHNLPADYPLITDEQLDELQDAFVAAAILAAQAGFDAVDIKSCHRYLLSELLASFTRQGRYGGDYDGRTRMLRETTRKVRAALAGKAEVTCRLNAFDALPYPYGWGVSRDDPMTPDLDEPRKLVAQLAADGMDMVNITVANPYYNPHVNRPADWMIANWPDAPEHPLAGVARIADVTRRLQQQAPQTPLVLSGMSWLRQHMPAFAAGMLNRGWAQLVGLGRGALAYPDFARDLLQNGSLDPRKVCVACSSCTQIMRDGGEAGCVVRDREIYGPIYRQGRLRDAQRLREMAAVCRRCADAPCSAACPAGVDVPGFLGALADGDERGAYAILRRSNPLPEVCGAVCPAEQQCQGGCIQAVLTGQSVPIAAVQRGLSYRAIAQGWAGVIIPAVASGKRVAIVGAGPAALSAAARLLELGHAVAIFDRASHPGGKLADAIPAARLDKVRMKAEVRALLGHVPADRLQWHLGKSLGQDVTLDELTRGFDAVMLAPGLSPRGLSATRQPTPGVVDAEEFLAQGSGKDAPACGPRVAVVGGGNTATDAAVAAIARGAVDVYVLYRRSYAQMPAWPAERQAMLEAGAHLMLLCQPLEYVHREGKLVGVRVCRMELQAASGSQRRSPRAVSGSEFLLPVDMVVEAVGQQIDPQLAAACAGVQLTDDGLIRVNQWHTTRSGVFAAGDAVNGGTTVAQAVAEGMHAAEAVHKWLANS
jgi:NADPH-dependent glutamate synthase beta subunit-like oxidoreductase/2,4-dienoyl-CoA reductase-like NADH-dependent reductase (Old Yellow Enzyme family)